MNPWIVLWEPVGEREHEQLPNLIAAILPNRTSIEELKRTMQLLYANHVAGDIRKRTLYVSEQVRVASRKYAYEVCQYGIAPEYVLGGNPFLMARIAHDLTVNAEEETVTWEEIKYPNLRGEITPEILAKHKPFRRLKRKFYTSTNRMEPLSL